MSRAGFIRFRGEAVTCTKITPPAVDSGTGESGAPTTATVSGYAIERPGERKDYGAGGLTQQDTRTLEFVPDTAGEEPARGATLSWAGQTYTVASVDPKTISGTVKGSVLVITR